MAGDDEQKVSGDATIGLYLGIFLMMSINQIEASSFSADNCLCTQNP